jgi:HEAT repeat protein/outer membrane protein assembly factor BamB
MRSHPDRMSRAVRAATLWQLLALGLLLTGVAWAADAIPNDQLAIDEHRLQEAKVGSDGPALLEFFRKRTANDARLFDIQGLIHRLGDDSYDVRQKASADLAALGPVALPLLREALKDRDIEVSRRAEECIRLIEQEYNATVVPAAVRMLAVRKPAGAVEVLLGYAPFADDDTVADEVRTALAALAVHDGKPDPVLVAALTDKGAARRGAAGVALLKAGVAEQRPAVRKLLEDPDASVRLRVALGLVATRDKEAIPVLIALLGQLPPAQTWQAEEVLYRLAEDQAPTVPARGDEAGRQKYLDAWKEWWTKHGDKLDLARLDAAPVVHGYTMMILLDQGQLIEVDAKNNVRWTLNGLQFPLDAQFLPGDRVLVAENMANRVTERNLKGEVLWEHAVDMPLMAQRLPNGNTFIGTRTRLVEVNREGKELFSYARPGGELFMRAARLRNGDTACVTAGGAFVRLDRTGKELYSFAVDIQTYGGRIEVLPNGRVLVPQYSTNKIVEQDPEGKEMWSVDFQVPIVATRLANGNTLVTSFNQHRAVELDPKGREVWEYKTDTRVTRAWRR